MAAPHGGLVEAELTRSVIGAFYAVYNKLGYGFLEHVYALALQRELAARGHGVAREVWVTIFYDGIPLTRQRLDFVVDGRLIVELKATWDLPASAQRQLQNYLRATDLEVGLLLHFGAQPKFYRMVSTKPAMCRGNPPPPSA